MKLMLDIKIYGKPYKSVCIKKIETIIGKVNSDINLQDNFVSHKHLSILIKSKRILLRDLNSTTGTLINQNFLIGPHVLKKNDIISIGPFSITFRLEKYDSSILGRSSIQKFKSSFRPHNFSLKALDK